MWPIQQMNVPIYDRESVEGVGTQLSGGEPEINKRQEQ
jgi:hypothetical protein